MPFNQAIVSRRFTWRLTILAAVSGVVITLFQRRWDELVVLPFSIGAIVALHPLMNKNVPTFVDLALFRQPRTWVGIVILALGAMAMLLMQFRRFV